MADPWVGGTNEDDLARIVHEVAAAAAGRKRQAAVVQGATATAGVAPAFGSWCGLTPQESRVVALVE